jgi:hypothetical protein
MVITLKCNSDPTEAKEALKQAMLDALSRLQDDVGHSAKWRTQYQALWEMIDSMEEA